MNQKVWGKNAIFGYVGLFWAILGRFYPFNPPGLKNKIFPRVKSNQNMCISVYRNFSGSFRKIYWIDQKLWEAEIGILAILGRFWPY